MEPLFSTKIFTGKIASCCRLCRRRSLRLPRRNILPTCNHPSCPRDSQGLTSACQDDRAIRTNVKCQRRSSSPKGREFYFFVLLLATGQLSLFVVELQWRLLSLISIQSSIRK